ncbi:MAG: hypothetical protein WAM28_00030 [Chlamydiales bacterium]
MNSIPSAVNTQSSTDPHDRLLPHTNSPSNPIDNKLQSLGQALQQQNSSLYNGTDHASLDSRSFCPLVSNVIDPKDNKENTALAPNHEMVTASSSSSKTKRKRENSENSPEEQVSMPSKQKKAKQEDTFTDVEKEIVNLSYYYLAGSDEYIADELRSKGIQMTKGQVRSIRNRLGIQNFKSRVQFLCSLSSIEDFVPLSKKLVKGKPNNRTILDTLFENRSHGPWKISQILREQQYRITQGEMRRWLERFDLNTKAKREAAFKAWKENSLSIEEILTPKHNRKPSH